MEEYKPVFIETDKYEPTRHEEIEVILKKHIEELIANKKGIQTLEYRYLEFLYFQARLEASAYDKRTVKMMASTIGTYNENEGKKLQESRIAIRDAQRTQEELGQSIAERYQKYIAYKELKLPDNKTLGGNLDMKIGVPMRAKYFGKGASNKLITTWDQLLYALSKSDPQITDIDKVGFPIIISDGEKVETVPYSFAPGIGERTDTAECIKQILSGYSPTR